MVGVQLGFFGLVWLVAYQLGPRWRELTGSFVLFNFAGGVGVALIGLRGTLPYGLSHAGSNLFLLLAFILIWHAATVIPNPRVSCKTEQLALVVLSSAAILWFGQSDDHATARSATVFLALGWAAARSAWIGSISVRKEGMPNLAILMLLLGLVSPMLILRAIQGLFFGGNIEVTHDTPSVIPVIFALLTGIFFLNLSIACLLGLRLTRQLQQLARNDPLTGVLNRRAITDALRVEWSRFKRFNQFVSVAIIDIDHFKSINDSAGHAAGDAVLIGVSNLFRAELRTSDQFGRIGGEEFVAVLASTDLESAMMLAERLRLALAQKLELHPNAGGTVTVSIGVACARGTDPNPETMLARADAAMYRAKAAGRNQVCAEQKE